MSKIFDHGTCNASVIHVLQRSKALVHAHLYGYVIGPSCGWPVLRFKEIARLQEILEEKLKQKNELEADKRRLERRERLMKLQVWNDLLG